MESHKGVKEGFGADVTIVEHTLSEKRSVGAIVCKARRNLADHVPVVLEKEGGSQQQANARAGQGGLTTTLQRMFGRSMGET